MAAARTDALVKSVDGTVRSREAIPLISSTVLQIALGLVFGHAYDMRIFMSTGYLVGQGLNPYVAQDLSGVFHDPTLRGITSFGYPPPWALILGSIYLLSYRLIPNLLVYNLAIKLPIIAANGCLAYLTAEILRKRGASEKTVRWAWVSLLFNPLLLLTTSAWGQFDSAVALVALYALYRLSRGNTQFAAILLALAIALKPIALPLLLAAGLFINGNPLKLQIRFYAAFLINMLVFCLVPFVIFNWSPAIILQNWNAHFTVGGGLSFMTYWEIVRNSYVLPEQWWWLGLIWVPALLGAAMIFRKRVVGFDSLVKTSLALMLVFFLSRTWVSEPNLVILLPFVLILVGLDYLKPWVGTAVWFIPLIFALFNTSLIQLLYPTLPGLMEHLLKLTEPYKIARIDARVLVTIPWLLLGGWIVVKCFRSNSPSKPKPTAI